jgi:Signal peptide peptidase
MYSRIFLIGTILSLLISLSHSQPFEPSAEIYIKYDNTTIYPIYKNGTFESSWQTIGTTFGTCSYSDVAVEYSGVESQQIWIHNSGPITFRAAIKINTTSDIMSPNISLSGPEIKPGMSIPATVYYNCDYEKILDEDLNGWGYVQVSILLSGKELSFNYLKICTMANKSYDYSIYICLIIAIVVVATFTKVRDTMFREELQNADEIKPIHVLWFVGFASAVLVIIFYFSKYLAAIFNVFFGFSATTSITMLISHMIEQHMQFTGCIFVPIRIPYYGKAKIYQCIAFATSFAFVLCWFLTHNWFLNNMIGLSMVFLIFRMIKIPSLKVGFLLLTALFAYDIFWVFFSTPIFGKSVMIVAATAIDIPNKIVIPYFGDYPLPRCSLLGLGDMVLPGLFVTYCYRFGLYKKTQAYHVSSVIAYAVGIFLCGVFLIIFKQGQPALLYIVPALLITAFFMAYQRKELKLFWDGLPDQPQLIRNRDTDEIQLTSQD